MKKILFVLALLVSILGFSQDNEEFSVKIVEKNKLKQAVFKVKNIQVETMRGWVGAMNLKRAEKTYRIMVYIGKGENGKNLSPAIESIAILADNPNSKKLEMTSKKFKSKGISLKLKLTLEIRKNFPGIIVNSKLINLSNIPDKCYFCWTFFPMLSKKYFTESGEQAFKSPWNKLPITGNWVFFPAENNEKGGYGVIYNSEHKGIALFSNLDRIGLDGQIIRKTENSSWGIKRNANMEAVIKKGKSNDIDFAFFIAGDLELAKKNIKSIEVLKIK